MKYLVALGLLALATAVSAQQQPPARPMSPAANPEPSNLPVEVLAHFFLSSRDSSGRLKGRSIVSEAGLAKLKSANASHFQKVHGDKEIAIDARQLCKEVTKAKNGTEFAEAFIEADKRERERLGKAAALAMAELNPQDQQELKHWLNTEYRKGFSGNGLGSNMMERFANAPFPSEDTAFFIKRTCDAATAYEERSKP